MANNQRRVIVAYKVLPGDPEHCVVVTTENLEAGDHDSLIKLVESASGQQADDLATVMMRTHYQTVVTCLHVSTQLVRWLKLKLLMLK